MGVGTKLFPHVLSGLLGVRYLSRMVISHGVNHNELDFKKTLMEMEMPCVDGYACLISNCTVCSRKSSGNLYINKTTGFYMCERCQSQGEWPALTNFLLSAKNKNMRLSKSDILRLKTAANGFLSYPVVPEVQDSLRVIQNLPKSELQKLLESYKLPSASLEIIEHLGVSVGSTHPFLYFPLRTTGSLTSGFKMVSKEGEEFSIPGVSRSGLLVLCPEKLRNATNLDGCKKPVRVAVLVPSVFDVLALGLSGIKHHIICLPQGVNSLPLDVLPHLEQYSKLIFWFGDLPGAWDAVRNFAKKLGEKRCHVVRPSADSPSARSAHLSGYNIMNLIAEAKPVYVEAVTTFQGLRQEVEAELLNIGKVEGVKWQRFPMLNNLLKGFRRGELTILSGSTGCGKTTFMSQYSLDLAEQGVNTLWGSFEIPNHRLARIMLTQMAGVSLQLNMEQFDQYADKLENLPIYFMKLHGQHSCSKVLKVVEHATYVYDIGHVIIDTVQFMMGVTEDSSTLDRFWRQDNIIAGFRTFASSFNCHVTLIIHPRKERPGDDLHLNSVFGGAKATQEADNVFMIQDHRESGGHMFFKVLKNRYSGDIGRMPLEFNKVNLSFVQKKAVPPMNKIEEADEVHNNHFNHRQKQWW